MFSQANMSMVRIKIRLNFYNLFPHEIMSEKRAQKFHPDDASLPRYVGSAFDWRKQISQAAQPINSTG